MCGPILFPFSRSSGREADSRVTCRSLDRLGLLPEASAKMSIVLEMGSVVEKTVTLGEKEVDTQSSNAEEPALVKDWTDKEETRARRK